MLTEEDAERVHVNVWSAFVLGYGFALGIFFAQVSLLVTAGVIFAVVWLATHQP